MMWRYARSTGAVAYVPDYRLAPEHPYPAALDDLDNFYSALLDMGVPASGIVVSGDSAGGNLALALMHRLKARNGPMPAGLICLSAATDFTLREGTMVTNAHRDDLFVADMMESPIHHYCPGQDLTNPMISPLQGDLAGFPPTLIHVAETEMLLDSNRLLAAKLQAAGVPVELSVKPKLWHVWHVMADVLPEARSAIEELAHFARARLPAASH
jgi:acetyl esterase/lipase